jgi:gliding motility-associated-like protein
MRKIVFFILLALSYQFAGAQLATTGNILSASGGTGTAGNLIVDWSLGGTAATVTSKLANGELLTQGFLQTDYTVIQLLLTFDNLDSKTYGDVVFELHGSASDGTALVYTSGDPTIARIVNGNFVEIIGAGTTYITATIKNTTISKQQLLVVDKATQTITFDFIPVLSKGSQGNVMHAIASSGLPITFKGHNAFVVRVAGNLITPIDIGKATVDAIQVGNTNYKPALVSQLVTVTDPTGEQISIPLTLTPNNDGINDVLIIKGIENFPENSITIVNRNGTKIFHAKNYNNSEIIFNGSDNKYKEFNGTSAIGNNYLPQGTYFYVLLYKDGQTMKKRTGYFVLKY